MSIVGYKVYSKVLPIVSLDSVTKVVKDKSNMTVYFRAPVPDKNTGEYFTEYTGVTWDDLRDRLLQLDFSNELQAESSWELTKMYREFRSMPEKSGNEYLPSEYVFDEEQSVRWNREKVVEHNHQIDCENEKLSAEKADAEQKFLHCFAVKIQYELRGKISYDKACAIRDYLYDDEHFCSETIENMDTLLDVFKAVLDVPF